MGAVDEVAGLPGGQAVARLAEKVATARPDAVKEIANRWKQAATKAAECGNAVRQSVVRLDGAWQGGSADGFVAYMDGFAKSGNSLTDAVTAAAGDVEAAAVALESAKSSVERICENLLSRVRQLRRDAHGMPQEDVDSAIRGMCAEAAADAQPVIDQAEEALGAALGALKGRPGSITPAFSTMAEPDAQPFTPAPGKPIEWLPSPEPAGAGGTTAPSSTDSQRPGATQSGPPQGGPSPSGSPGGSSGGETGGGGGGGGLGPSGGPPLSGPPPGNVEEWIREAIRILQANGIPVTEDYIDEIWTIIEKESGGNPHALNDWDSNAAKGTPSKGLMQCIDPTFQAHKLPGHDDIWNPVDNIIAGVRYTFSRYGGFDGHPGLKSMAGGGGYQGY
ncbi:transglycosylase SLT domain-containing protein [Saccharothrix hoggarensis]|uniref:Transglycosylase SLT domain-containing protein n=1 Tax=Saccharothrix hoggarensis TaxID=913853 RepID=A0ABW3QTR1_9PSEU